MKTHAPAGTQSSTLARQPIADFCETTSTSIKRWIHQGSYPGGETEIRFMCYLDMIGYRVIEFERMRGVRRNFAELIGFRVLTSEEATRLLEYSKMGTMWEVLRGVHGMSDAREQTMWEIWKTRREELDKKKAEFRIKYAVRFPLTFQIARRKESRERRDRTPAGRGIRATMLVAEGLLALLSDELIQGLSSEEIAELQPSVGSILRLSLKLQQLHSQLLPPSPATPAKDQP